MWRNAERAESEVDGWLVSSLTAPRQTPTLTHLMAHSTDSHVFLPDEPEPDWPKLRESSLLSNLHAKFWGVDIYEDELKWLKTQPEGQLMDVDGSEVGPGCFALDLEISYLQASRLWIRKDYIRIYDECKKNYDRPRSGVPKPRSVVITGQPGIGDASPSS